MPRCLRLIRCGACACAASRCFLAPARCLRLAPGRPRRQAPHAGRRPRRGGARLHRRPASGLAPTTAATPSPPAGRTRAGLVAAISLSAVFDLDRFRLVLGVGPGRTLASLLTTPSLTGLAALLAIRPLSRRPRGSDVRRLEDHERRLESRLRNRGRWPGRWRRRRRRRHDYCGRRHYCGRRYCWGHCGWPGVASGRALAAVGIVVLTGRGNLGPAGALARCAACPGTRGCPGTRRCPGCPGGRRRGGRKLISARLRRTGSCRRHYRRRRNGRSWRLRCRRSGRPGYRTARPPEQALSLAPAAICWLAGRFWRC